MSSPLTFFLNLSDKSFQFFLAFEIKYLSVIYLTILLAAASLPIFKAISLHFFNTLLNLSASDSFFLPSMSINKSFNLLNLSALSLHCLNFFLNNSLSNFSLNGNNLINNLSNPY